VASNIFRNGTLSITVRRRSTFFNITEADPIPYFVVIFGTSIFTVEVFLPKLPLAYKNAPPTNTTIRIPISIPSIPTGPLSSAITSSVDYLVFAENTLASLRFHKVWHPIDAAIEKREVSFSSKAEMPK